MMCGRIRYSLRVYLSDPHGTHRVCLKAIFAALDQLKTRDWIKDCWVWLYRGAWQEWGIHEIDMAVPLRPRRIAAQAQSDLQTPVSKRPASFSRT